MVMVFPCPPLGVVLMFLCVPLTILWVVIAVIFEFIDYAKA